MLTGYPAVRQAQCVGVDAPLDHLPRRAIVEMERQALYPFPDLSRQRLLHRRQFVFGRAFQAF
jgi:hypothetical protein